MAWERFQGHGRGAFKIPVHVIKIQKRSHISQFPITWGLSLSQFEKNWCIENHFLHKKHLVQKVLREDLQLRSQHTINEESKAFMVQSSKLFLHHADPNHNGLNVRDMDMLLGTVRKRNFAIITNVRKRNFAITTNALVTASLNAFSVVLGGIKNHNKGLICIRQLFELKSTLPAQRWPQTIPLAWLWLLNRFVRWSRARSLLL